MMFNRSKKTIQWGITFAVLISFTAYAVGNISGHGQRAALAKTIENNPDLLQQGAVLVLASEDEEEDLTLEEQRQLREEEREQRRLEREAERAAREQAREQRRWLRFLDKFERYNDRQLVCVLTDNQQTAVEALYDTSIQTLALSDTSIDVLTAEGERLRASDLRRIIRSSGGDVHCRVLDYNKVFFLLFGGSVS